MILEEPFENEEKILKAVSMLSGSIDQKVSQIDDQRISDQCIDLHSCYARLGAEGNVEALKRAFFIQWYSANEAGFVTGIPMGWSGESGVKLGSSKTLSSESIKSVFLKLDDLIKSGSIDEEFTRIINWCFFIDSSYFEYYDYNRDLVQRIHRLPRDDGFPQNLDEDNFRNRGYLGEYFIAVKNHT